MNLFNSVTVPISKYIGVADNANSGCLKSHHTSSFALVRAALTLCILLFAVPGLLYSQTVSTFQGFLGKYPIYLVVDGDGDFVNAAYAYSKYDTPINIDGKVEDGTLKLYEKNELDEVTATFAFLNYQPSQTRLTGTWNMQSAQGITTLKVSLDRVFSFDRGDDTSFSGKELLQKISTENHYFKVVLNKSAGDEVKVKGIKVYAKASDQLVQKIDFEGQFLGINCLSGGDFNFDGVEEFSAFEGSYAGANTSSLYFLKDDNTGKYQLSNISGVNLEFNQESKTIIQTESCCGGRSYTETHYRYQNDQMELIITKCFEYDPEKSDYVEGACG